MDTKYDVVIIGAGIGGLVCGCYLAKAGMRVLIVEQHNKLGGYCSSFTRNGFTFDVAVHYIGGGRNGGEIGRLITEHNLKKYFEFVQIDPCDKIVLPNKVIYIRKDRRNTIMEIKKKFPHEKENIENFFTFILKKNFLHIYSKTKKKTFKHLLNQYFNDKKLIASLSVLLGNMGLPAARLSAITGITLYREYILDGGYYPKGGTQVFADSLGQRFNDYGGSVRLSEKVTRIITENKRIQGIGLENGEIIMSKFVVSNADATHTFNNLLDIKEKKFLKKVNNMEVSPSVFAVFLGLKVDLKKILKDHCAIWYFNTWNIDSCYEHYAVNILKPELDYIVCTFPSLHDSSLSPKNKSTMQIYVCAPFHNEKFWKKYKEIIYRKMIRKAEKLIPNLSDFIEVKAIATPLDFNKYTLNRQGAMYGWASTVNQIANFLVPKETDVQGLYLAGHWSTSGLGQGGITSVAYSGRRAAKLILKNKKFY
ncbi:MAG: NAD(P)/FAD-dependent oxidoreductase [Candidatus Omnitrophica bacterium]|nr:NAD(P)/FAD-dependent oxidoreductase [Candidatus Omnitrophota bacterium]